MSDLDTIKAMLDARKIEYEADNTDGRRVALPDGQTTIVICNDTMSLSGYDAYLRFDKDGNLIGGGATI